MVYKSWILILIVVLEWESKISEPGVLGSESVLLGSLAVELKAYPSMH